MCDRIDHPLVENGMEDNLIREGFHIEGEMTILNSTSLGPWVYIYIYI